MFESAQEYFAKFGMNVIPVRGKIAVEEWVQYQNREMTFDEFSILDWTKNITGVAAVCGIDNLVCIDLDKVKDVKILYKILDKLNLPKDYKWVVKTSSGYHLWIKIKDRWKIFEFFGKGFGYKNLYAKEEGKLDHCEIRIENCYALLPGSFHPKGGKYEFVNEKPEDKPENIDEDLFLEMIRAIFTITSRLKIKRRSKTTNWKPDIKYLPSAIKYIKQFRLDYLTWVDCCFALCSLGEDGRKYFRDLSDNNFYPDDPLIDPQFDKCLKIYNEEKIKLATIFYHAKELGFRYGAKADGLSRVMLTFPLVLMQSSDDLLLEKILSYGLIRYMTDGFDKEKEAKKITVEEVNKILYKYKIEFISAEEIIQNYRQTNDFLTDYEKRYNTDAYSLVGLDFLLETRAGKHRYDLFRTYCAIKAIISREHSYKAISYTRLASAINGYKSYGLYEEIGNGEKLMHPATIRRRAGLLDDMNMITKVGEGRSVYYTTRLTRIKLENIVFNKVRIREIKKLQKPNAAFRERVKKMKTDLNSKMGKNENARYILP